jgi:hypothetical protein
MKLWMPIGTSVLLITLRLMDNRESKSDPEDMLRAYVLQYGIKVYRTLSFPTIIAIKRV